MYHTFKNSDFSLRLSLGGMLRMDRWFLSSILVFQNVFGLVKWIGVLL